MSVQPVVGAAIAPAQPVASTGILGAITAPFTGLQGLVSSAAARSGLLALPRAGKAAVDDEEVDFAHEEKAEDEEVSEPRAGKQLFLGAPGFAAPGAIAGAVAPIAGAVAPIAGTAVPKSATTKRVCRKVPVPQTKIVPQTQCSQRAVPKCTLVNKQVTEESCIAVPKQSCEQVERQVPIAVPKQVSKLFIFPHILTISFDTNKCT